MLMVISIVSGKNLYFINSCPYTSGPLTFPTELTKLNQSSGKLEIVRILLNQDVGAEFVKIYHNERIVVAGSYDGIYLNIVDMNNVKNNKMRLIKHPEKSKSGGVYCYISGYSNLIRNEKGYLIFNQMFSADQGTNRYITSINTKTLEQSETSAKSYKNVIAYGYTDGSIDGIDYVNIYKQNGVINARVAEWVENNQNPSIPILLSNDLKNGNYDVDVLLVNNDLISILANRDKKKTENDNLKHLWIFNKKQNIWHQKALKGNVKGYANYWVSGIVTEAEKGKRDNPGKKEIVKVDEFGDKYDISVKRTGIMFDAIVDESTYYPGILFLYNIDTKQYIEIDTKQADSEVLLVEDDMVYYRVFDEIFQAKIGKDKLENITILTKDDVVPDIHWMFSSDK